MNRLEHIYMDIAAWEDTGINYDDNYSESQTALENLEWDLNRLDSLLSEFGSISRPSQDEHIETLSRALTAMKHCRQELSDDITHYIDRKLRSRFNALNDVLATIDEKNISTPNSLGIDVNRYYDGAYGERSYCREELDSITMDDLLGTRVNPYGTVYDQTIPEIKGVLEEKYGYTALQINANPQVDKAEEFTYNDYVKVYYEVSEIPYVKEMTSAQKIKNAIWKATGIGYIMDSVYGFSLINGDNLTAGEAEARFIDGTATTIFNIFPAAVSKACGAGLLEATILSMKEIEFNALWMASPSIGEEVGIPELSYLMRLCFMVGAVYDVGRVDDTVGIQGSKDDVIPNEGKPFAEYMSPEDAKRYLEFLENGSVEGLTPAELAGIQKVDDWIALNKVDYDEVLALSNRVSETSYGKSSANYKNTADFMTNIECRNGKYYTDKVTIDEIGQIEARGEDFSALNKRIMSSRASTEGGTSIVYKYSDELGTKYLIHEVTDANGYIIHRDFDAVRISSGQLINKGH